MPKSSAVFLRPLSIIVSLLGWQALPEKYICAYGAEAADDQIYVVVAFDPLDPSPAPVPFSGYVEVSPAYQENGMTGTITLKGGKKGKDYNFTLKSESYSQQGMRSSGGVDYGIYGRAIGDGLPGEKYAELNLGGDLLEYFKGEESITYTGGADRTFKIKYDNSNDQSPYFNIIDHFGKISLMLGCAGSKDEGCSRCDAGPPGSGRGTNNSIDVRVGLGPSRNDGLSGVIRLKVSELEAGTEIYYPSSLRFDGINDWDSGTGWGLISEFASGRHLPCQLRIPACFVDIVRTSGTNGRGFELRFYKLTDVGAFNSLTGRYPITATATPYNTWKFEDVANSNGATLCVKKNYGASNEVEFLYQFSANTSDGIAEKGWSLSTKTAGQTLSITSVKNTYDSGEKIASNRITKNELGDTQESIYREFDAEGDVILETLGYGGSPAGKTTIHEYSGFGAAKHLKKLQDWSGNWTFYNSYNSNGQPTQWVTQYKNNAYTGNWPDNTNRMHELSESTDLDAETETLAGTVVGRRWKKLENFGMLYSGENNYRKIINSVATDLTISSPSWSDASNLKTITYLYDADNSTIGHAKNAEYLVIRPDGQATLKKYFTSSEVINGQTVATDITETWEGAPSTTSVSGYTVTVTSGTKTVEERTPEGEIVYRQKTDIATSTSLEERQAVEYDSFGRVTKYILFSTAGYFEQRSYSCCGLEWETDMYGVKTEYTYDALGRIKTQISFANGTGNQPPVRRDFIYDAMGRNTKTLIGPIGNQLTGEERHYNLAGELDWVKDGLGRQTTFQTAKVGDYIVHTTTAPDTSTKIERRYQDGSIYESVDVVSDTVTRGMRYAYAIDASGNQSVTQTPLDGATAVTASQAVRWTDTAQRLWKIVSPSPTGTGSAEEVYYYATPTQTAYMPGQLYKMTRTGQPDTVYTYDTLGRLSAEGKDMNGDGVLTASGGIDRMREFLYSFSSGDEVLTTRNWNTSAAYLTTIEKTDIRAAAQRSLAEPGKDYVTYTRYINRPAGVFSVTEHRGALHINSTKKYGRIASVVKTDGADQLGAVTYAYDSYGRLSSTTDARNGTTTYTYDAAGRISSITTPDPDTSANDAGRRPQTVTYAYLDLGSSAGYGHRETITRRIGGVIGTPVEETVSEYYPTGELRSSYGANSAPSLYAYDFGGRIKFLTTWRNFDLATGIGTGAGDTTSWSYNAAGMLQYKRDANNKGPDYTYDSAGRLKTREWARTAGGVRLKTTYVYEPTTGDLTGIDYSDSTTDVTYSGYDRFGRPTSITDAAGTRSLTYSSIYTLSEQYTAGSLSSNQITATRGTADRIDSIQIERGGQSDYAVQYYWGGGNRLNSIFRWRNFDDPIDGEYFHEYYTDYTYEANSDLVSQISHSFFSNYGESFYGVPVIQSRTHDYLNRAREFSVETENEGTRTLAYNYNDRNQRVLSTDESGTYWTYHYDSDPVARGVGQVTSSVRKDSGGATVSGFDFGYTYDAIGNRSATTANSQSCSYYQSTNGSGPNGGNSLNQYGSRVIAGVFEAFVYDDDGNLLSDARWNYTWDAENRLVRLETSTAAYTAGAPRKRIEYAYDDRGRRTLKSVFTWNASTSSFSTSPSVKVGFVYHDWNLLEEINLVGSSPITVGRYYWGVDLSGSLQGAGGVGGLIAADLGGGWPAAVISDANGNVCDLAGVAGGYDYGFWLGHYDYDAFGNSFPDDGFFVGYNPFRFSTKYTDTDSILGGNELGMQYYGLRYYNPSAGRWLSRDPIQENGGLNLYGMVRNNPVGAIDILGLDELTLSYDLAADDRGPISAKELNSWAEILEYAKKRVKDCHCIKLLRVGGHGAPGQFGGGAGGLPGADLTNGTFSGNAAAEKNPNLLNIKSNSFREDHDKIRVLQELKKLMCKDGKIEVVACSLFAGDEGKKLQGNLEGVFGQGNVNGYDFPVVWGFYTGNVYQAHEKPNGNVAYKEKVGCSCETY